MNAVGGSAADLLREVVRFADLAQQLELRLDPVGVLLFAFEDVIEQLTRAVVAGADTRRDPARSGGRSRCVSSSSASASFSGTVSPTRTEPRRCRFGHPLEVEDALDERVGVLHLADRLLAELLGEALVAPVRAHLGVDEVLVDRGRARR